MRRVFGLGLLLMTSSASAQPVVTVGTALLRAGAEFTDVSAVRLIADGSMLVADPRAWEFMRLADRGRVRASLGRHGAGPGEYGSAQHLVALPNSESALIDPPQNRWMLFDSVGRLQRTRVFGPTESVLQYAEAVDARGNAYGLGFPAPPPARPERTLRRWPPGRGQRDSLTALLGADTVASPLPAGPNGRPAEVAYFFVPFSSQDAWALMPNGGLVIARAAGETLEWRDASGRITRVAALPSSPRVPVSDSARAAETRITVRDRMPKVQPLWGEKGLRVPRDGVVWMRRTRAPVEGFTEYLRFTESGGLTRRLRIDGRARIVGHTRDRIVVARRTDDHLQQLEVNAIPGIRPSASK